MMMEKPLVSQEDPIDMVIALASSCNTRLLEYAAPGTGPYVCCC